MEQLFEKLHKLQRISGTNDKKQYIKLNKDDKEFLDTLEFLLNPYKITNLSKKKIEKKVKVQPNEKFHNLHSLFRYLVNRCSGKDIDIANVQAFIIHNKEYEKEIKELVTKSMKLGVKAKLVNQALGYELIPDFNVQLATSFEKCKKNFKNKEIIITEKLDGIKIIVIKRGNDIQIYSRQGKRIEGLIEIENNVLHIEKDSFVMDGELIAEGEFENNAELYKETMKRSSIKGNKVGLKYMVYDYLDDPNDFFRGFSKVPSKTRKESVKELLKESTFIQYLEPLYIGEYSKEIVEEYAKELTLKGKEGICINVSDAPFEAKRNPNLAKCKLFTTADILVTDIYEGEGALEGMLGGVDCKFIYQGKVCNVSVGSGFSQAERQYYIEHSDELIGKIIEIKYFELSQDKDGNISLRFPTWQGKEYIRTDKSSLEDTNID